MKNLIPEIIFGITLFIGTHIDDLFVVLALFSDRRFSASQVVLGQYVGIYILALGSLALSLGAKQIPQAYVGLLGAIPLAWGLKKLWDIRRRPSPPELSPQVFRSSTKLLAVVGITIANGGDNIGVYVPLFATKSMAVISLYLLIFFLMTGIWCAIALYFVRQKHLASLVKSFSQYIVPWIFIGVGAYILYEANSISLL